MSRPIIECINCKQIKEHYAKKLCRNCYENKKRKTRKLIICSNCGQETSNQGKGLCGRCHRATYPYKKRLIICKECGKQKEHQAKGLCNTCYKRIKYQTVDKYNLKRMGQIRNANKTLYQKPQIKIRRRYYQKTWRENNKDKIKIYKKTNTLKNKKIYNPLKRKAEIYVQEQVKKGKLISPNLLSCAECQTQAVLYHHNLGYEQEHWLDIIPLCKQCHYDVHFKKGGIYIKTNEGKQ